MQEEYTGSRAGERLKASIDGRAPSLAAFARYAKVPYRSLQDYIAGKSKPGFEQLVRFAEAGLDVGFILTGFPTGSVDHPSPATIEPLWLSAQASVVGRHFLHTSVDQIADRALEGLDVRSWLAAWTAAEAELPLALSADFEPARRQAVVFAIAAAVAEGVVARTRALGLVTALPAALPPTDA